MSDEGIKIARNTGAVVIAEVLGKVLGIVLTLAIARRLGAASFGVLAFASSFTFIFGILVNFGFDKLILREVARDKRKTNLFLTNIMIMKLVLALLTFVLISGTVSALRYPLEKTAVIYLAALIMIAESFISLLNSLYRAHQKVKYGVIVEVLSKTLIVSLGVYALFLGYGLVEILLVQLFVFIVSLVVSTYLFSTRIAKIAFGGLSFEFFKNLIGRATPFFVLSISIAIYAKIDTVMLSFMKGDEITGWYSAAYKFLEVFTFIPAAFVAGVLPAMSRFSRSSPDLLLQTYRRAAKYLFMIALPLAVGTSILADKIILIMYGEGYVNSISALRILIWALVFAFTNHASANALFAIDKEKVFVSIVVFGAVFNVTANLLLIPAFSYLGASIATVATEGIVFIVSLFFVSLHLKKIAIHRVVYRPVLSAALMGLIAWLLREANIAVLIPLSAIVYAAALFLLRSFDQKELVLLGSFFRKNDARST
jgi:O-antigen/teichoic acid export membrane protein